MSIPAIQAIILRGGTGLMSPALDSWTGLKLDDELDENQARARIRTQVQSLLRTMPSPWKTVELTPQPVETMVMDVLQQVCYDRAFNR